MSFLYVLLWKTFSFFQDLKRLKKRLLAYLLSHFLFLFFHESYPSSRRNLNNHFIICHWNLNSISVHNCAKVQLLKAYLAVHKFDTVCRSETYLNSTFSFDDDSLDISSYIMVTADHPANSKRGSVCMYFLWKLFTIKDPWHQLSSGKHSFWFTNRWPTM